MANFGDVPLGLEVGAELCPRNDDCEGEDCGRYLLGLDWHNWGKSGGPMVGRDRQKMMKSPHTEVGTRSPGVRQDLGESVICMILYHHNLTVIYTAI